MFRNDVVLVTGGTKGIGKQTVKAFLERGAIVVTTYSNDDKAAEELRRELPNFKNKLSVYKVSVSDYEEIRTLVDNIISKYGKISILINNAGVEISKLFMQLSIDEWNKVIETNLTGTFIMCKTVIMKMIPNKSGKVINISSVAGNNGNVGQIAYSSSKAGINAMTKILAKECARFRINVNAIAPGFINTEMSARYEDTYKNKIPLQRFGTQEEVVKLILFLASNEAAYITGSINVIDGGLTL